MAIKTVLIDDLDGGEADQTIAFAINGEGYTIDLSNKNAENFHKALQPWIAVATKTQATREEIVKTHLAGVQQRAAIRKWAHEQGLEISPRGRIPQEITDQYNRTHKHA